MTDARSGGAHPGARGDGSAPARASEPARGSQPAGGTRSAGTSQSARGTKPGRGNQAARGTQPAGHPVASFFRANPQVLVLLLICVILGLGTFIAVIIGLVGAGGGQVTGEPSGLIAVAQVL